MPLEVATYVSQLVSSNPQGLDDRSMGDDHLRMLKSVLQNTFPDADQALYLRNKVNNKTVGYSVVAADKGKLITVDATGGAVAIVLPSIASAGDGFWVEVMKIDASINTIDVVGAGGETINGAALWPLSDRYDSVKVWSGGTGSDWKGLGVAIGGITSGKLAPASVTVSRLADGSVSTVKIVDGAVTDAKLAAGISGAKLTDGSVPIGKLSAGTTLGKVLKTAAFYTTAAATFSGTIIPNDATIPQIGEGMLLGTLNYTPVRADSIIRIEAQAWGSADTSPQLFGLVLFRDTVADALAGDFVVASRATRVSFIYEEISGSIAARNYHLRWGMMQSGGGWLNANQGNAVVWTGIFRSGLVITEIAP